MKMWALLGIATGMAILDVLSLALVQQVSVGALPTLVLLLAIVLYAFQPFIFYKALQLQGISTVNLLWNVLSSILVTAVALLYFREKLTNTKLIGVLFSILAIGLLTYES